VIKVLKLTPQQKDRVMKILDNGGSEEEISEYLLTLIPGLSQAEETRTTSPSRRTQESQLLAAGSSMTLH